MRCVLFGDESAIPEIFDTLAESVMTTGRAGVLITPYNALLLTPLKGKPDSEYNADLRPDC